MSKILFVMTGADHWTLADGTRHPTGFWAEEAVAPYEAFKAAGHEIVVATPGGVVPTLDKGSLAPPWACPGRRSTSTSAARTTLSASSPGACTSRRWSGPGGGRGRGSPVRRAYPGRPGRQARPGPPARRDSPHTAELLDAQARLFGSVCTAFTADLRRLLIGLFTEAGTAGGTEPAEAADICIALVIGLESVADGRRLLAPATDVLVDGLLRCRAQPWSVRRSRTSRTNSHQRMFSCSNAMPRARVR
ncbi:hypothetical protein [Streptomyces sp. NPDC051219]|uniref:hypothetical protein n=1 Tax=Streptomyces sp. NPDC051219 TaxID=3155283 RepID=UPI0034307DD5